MSQEKTAKEPPDTIKEIKNEQNNPPQTEAKPISTTTINSNIIKKETTTSDRMTINPTNTKNSNPRITNEKDSDIANDKKISKPTEKYKTKKQSLEANHNQMTPQ